MQAVAVEWSSADRPPCLHPGPGSEAGGLLLWAENTTAIDRQQPGDGKAVSSDDVLGSSLDFTNATRKGLVRFAERDRLSHP
jgi:hypothetical protein